MRRAIYNMLVSYCAFSLHYLLFLHVIERLKRQMIQPVRNVTLRDVKREKVIYVT